MKKVWLLLLICVISISAQADLVNRYSFDLDASDSVGVADGVVVGTPYVAAGKMTFNQDGHVELPNTIIDGMTDVSVEAWFTRNAGGYWQRIFDFGSSRGDLGSTPAGEGAGYIFYAPEVSRFAIASFIANENSESLISTTPIAIGAATHVVCVVNETKGQIELYQDGNLVAVEPTTRTLADFTVTTAFIGKSHWPDDLFGGTVDEFRIYNAATTPEQIALNAQFGPDRYQISGVKSMVPVNNKINVPSTTTLSWAPVAGVTAQSYSLYIDTDPAVLDPNETPGSADYVTTGTSQVVSLDSEVEYYWRVDVKDTSNVTHVGPRFKFTTAPPAPVIEKIVPAGQLIVDGEDATIYVVAVDGTTGLPDGLSYQWYLGEDPVGTDSNTLVISNPGAANEGDYFCEVTASGVSVDSGVSLLALPKIIAHYEFEDSLADSSDNAIDGEPIGAVAYGDGPANLGKALLLNGTDAYVDLPDGFSDFRVGLTFNVWANPTTAPNWARFLVLGTGPGENSLIFTRSGTSNMLIFDVNNGPSTTDGNVRPEIANQIEQNSWHMYTVTMDVDGNVKVYKDTKPIGNEVYVSNNNGMPNLITRTLNWIGKSNYPDALYNGLMDDVRIYNHALTQDEIFGLYTLSTPYICDVKPAYDFNNDCRTNLADLAMFAMEWMDCNRIPVEQCDN